MDKTSQFTRPPIINCNAMIKITINPKYPSHLCLLIKSAKKLASVAIRNTDNKRPITIIWKLPLEAATTANTLSKLKVRSAIKT